MNLDVLKYSYISFDVFDTLIFRTVYQPSDIFKIVQNKFEDFYDLKIPSFDKNRIVAEKKTRILNNPREITLDEIYDKIEYKSEVRNKLKELEVNIELENCVPNQPMVDFVRYCSNLGKKIVITTDMYLPRRFFMRLLEKLEIHADYLFISSEEGVTKRSGKLFAILLKKLNVQPKQVLHIGDDLNNDILQAKNNGIDSIERWTKIPILPPKHNADSIAENHIDILSRFYNKTIYSQSSFYVGFSILGPFIYDFCIWIHKQRQINHIDKILFIAREGFLIYKCYLKIFPNEKGSVSYFCLNKNLLRLPLLKGKYSLQVFKDSLLNRHYYTWAQIFDSLLINEDIEYRKIISTELGINYDSSFSRKDLYLGKYDDLLIQLIHYCSSGINEQAKLLMEYLNQNDVLNNRIGLVNNSINGNGQLMLEKFIKQQGLTPNVHGLQIVDSIKCKLNLVDRYSTYFNSFSITHFQKNEFIRNSLIFEHLLFEPIGTSIFFKEGSNGIDVCKKELTKEKENFDTIRDVQQFTLLFVETYKKHVPLPCGVIGVKRILNFVQHPSYNLAKPISRLWDEDADGNKMFADNHIPIKWNYKIYRKVPSSILWLEGYLSLKKVNAIWFKLIHLKMALVFYKNHRKSIFKDFMILFNS